MTAALFCIAIDRAGDRYIVVRAQELYYFISTRQVVAREEALISCLLLYYGVVTGLHELIGVNSW